ncbi:MAG: ABC transporter ATP-binding protein [Acidibrevibacterium sp.]|uniref:ABC transporter ATP-binding protein n=1 Tax=Acidibrevibacterium sp. TaxID=2606776 RepID=UPI003D008919
MTQSGPLLAAAGLGKRFGALVVLDAVDFTVVAGEAVGIVGPNGAGKTTLLNVLSGRYAPEVGRITFRGEDVTALDVASRCRRGLARSHQIPRPFGGMTVFESLLVAAEAGAGLRGRAAERRGLETLSLCGMMALANRRGEALGLLDRKRLELARALATEPALLLLDEIGAGLTDGEAQGLVEIIRAIHARGIAIVWIEHIVHVLVQVVGRLVCMDAGRVIADGEPASVLRDAAVIDAYLGAAAHVPAHG